MEKKILPFIIVSMLVLLGFQALQNWLNPQPPPVVEAPPEPGDDDAPGRPPDQADRDEVTEQPGVESQPPSDPITPEVTSDPPQDTPQADRPDGIEPVQRPDTRQQWFVVGSLDPDSPFKMAVWFNSRGAAIECVALNSPRFSDLNDKTGYLGYLALTDEPDGCRINAVGAGTPAAKAVPQSPGAPTGLQPGDLLVRLNDRSIRNREDLRQQLQKTKPRQSVELVVCRSASEATQELIYTITLAKRPLEVIRPEPMPPEAGQPQHPLSYLLTLVPTDRKPGEEEEAGLPLLLEGNWEARRIDDPDGPGIEFWFDLGPADLEPLQLKGPLRVVKRFTLSRVADDEPGDEPQRSYHLTYEIEIRNLGSEPLEMAYRLDGPTGLPLEGWWYTYKTHPTQFGGAGVRDIVSKDFGGKYKMFSNPKIVKRMEEVQEQMEESPGAVLDPATEMYVEPARLQFVGVDAQYFNSALIADVDPADEAAIARYEFEDIAARTVAPKDDLKSSRTDVSFRLISPVHEIPAGGQYSQRFLIFAGPKQPRVLALYDLNECITYGWFPWVAKPLQWVLHAFYSVFRNYGIAIILMTVLVRGCMTPLGLQQARNAQKMQELAPEMKRIAEQHKNDMEKRAAAQRELFRKNNYNPLAGCLPMFIQLPIFIGLYRALSVDIELRQAPLIPGLDWCSNLAGPDMLVYWEGFMPSVLASSTGWLGPYLNILPLISVAFMMVHQKLFMPPPTDDQQQMQQTVMKFMMVFFGFMFFRVPAGLCLYFITSSAWGLAERKLLPKSKASAKGPPVKSGQSPAGNGAARAAERKRMKQKRR